jgi:undecaprenyl-diphosphatase
MSILQSLVMGIVQGLTEFLPVSSTAHLTFVESLWKVPENSRLAYDVALHLGTTLALLVFFGRRIGSIAAGLFGSMPNERRNNGDLVLAIVIGTIPAVLAGFFARNRLNAVFADPIYSALFLLITGLVLFLTRGSAGERSAVTWRDGLVIGAAQAIALLPGISRSGATIAAALFLGFARPAAFEFSLLLSIPVVLGAAVLELRPVIGSETGVMPMAVVAGVATSFGVGLAALALLRSVLRRRRLHWFAFYCWAVGIGALVLIKLKP